MPRPDPVAGQLGSQGHQPPPADPPDLKQTETDENLKALLTQYLSRCCREQVSDLSEQVGIPGIPGLYVSFS